MVTQIDAESIQGIEGVHMGRRSFKGGESGDVETLGEYVTGAFAGRAE